MRRCRRATVLRARIEPVRANVVVVNTSVPNEAASFRGRSDHKQVGECPGHQGEGRPDGIELIGGHLAVGKHVDHQAAGRPEVEQSMAACRDQLQHGTGAERICNRQR